MHSQPSERVPPTPEGSLVRFFSHGTLTGFEPGLARDWYMISIYGTFCHGFSYLRTSTIFIALIRSVVGYSCR